MKKLQITWRCALVFFAVFMAELANASNINILIDDLGYDKYMDKKFIDLPYDNISYSFLPDAPHATELARYAKSKGRTIIIHMPMQSQSGANEEKSTLKVGMSKQQILQNLEYAYKKVPYAEGLNGHQGSLFSTDRRGMEIVLQWVKQHNFYFIDSRTSANTVAAKIADEFGIPNISRDIFLDHQINEKFIENSFVRLLNISKRFGNATAIAHPHKTTYKVLAKELPKLQNKNVAIAKLDFSIKDKNSKLWNNYYGNQLNYTLAQHKNHHLTRSSITTNIDNVTQIRYTTKSPNYIGKNNDRYFYTTPYELPTFKAEPLDYSIYTTNLAKIDNYRFSDTQIINSPITLLDKKTISQNNTNNYVETIATQDKHKTSTNKQNKLNVTPAELPYISNPQNNHLTRKIWSPARKKIN